LVAIFRVDSRFARATNRVIRHKEGALAALDPDFQLGADHLYVVA
jgi:hypothetical protein